MILCCLNDMYVDFGASLLADTSPGFLDSSGFSLAAVFPAPPPGKNNSRVHLPCDYSIQNLNLRALFQPPASAPSATTCSYTLSLTLLISAPLKSSISNTNRTAELSLALYSQLRSQNAHILISGLAFLTSKLSLLLHRGHSLQLPRIHSRCHSLHSLVHHSSSLRFNLKRQKYQYTGWILRLFCQFLVRQI
ncbi:hypothetical protein Pelo_4966 [Pelomyxa schiedti]|nr:hypothetical protein Pelo_4966 [Pelomyxa schiedti]